MVPLLKRTQRNRRPAFGTFTTFTILTILQISRCSYDVPQFEENDICPEDGFFPDPNSCTKFYRCVETFAFFFAYEFQCPRKTVFDPDLQVCNHPYAVRPDYRCHMNNLYRYKVKTKKVRAIKSPTVEQATLAPVHNHTHDGFIHLNITGDNGNKMEN